MTSQYESDGSFLVEELSIGTDQLSTRANPDDWDRLEIWETKVGRWKAGSQVLAHLIIFKHARTGPRGGRYQWEEWWFVRIGKPGDQKYAADKHVNRVEYSIH